MSKIKGWKKLGETLGGKVITYQNEKTLRQLDIIYGRDNLWYVQVERDKGFSVIVHNLGAFKTKTSAIKYAVNWMRRHLKG